MDWNDPHAVSVFFELHSDLPRESPGLPDCTARALDLWAPVFETGEVVDFGCGPGAQTMDFTRLLPTARILAVDLHPPFVKEVRRRAAEEGLGHRVNARVGDMGDPAALGIEPGRVDLVWSEGAAYSIGVENALRSWRPLLTPGGKIVFSEAIRLVEELPPAARKMWAEYPELTDDLGTRQRVTAAGLRCLTSFRLPSEAWTAYFEPLKAKLDLLEARYHNDPKALSVLAENRREIEVFHAHGDAYGYAFFICAL